MASIIERLANPHLSEYSKERMPVVYEVLLGSQAYGTHNEQSDFDVYAVFMPPIEDLIVGRQGCLYLFDDLPSVTEQRQYQGIKSNGKEYDVTIYNIAKFFRLAMGNNPNILDSLFVPDNCVLSMTSTGKMLRDNRRTFLHRGCWKTFKGYAYNQIKLAKNKKPEGKRVESYEKYGFDPKSAYHLVRLVYQVEQLLKTGDMDLQANKEKLKEIKYGRVPFEQVEAIFREKEKHLEKVYEESSILPVYPDTRAIRSLLIACIEEHHKRPITNTELKIANYRCGKLIDDIEFLIQNYKKKGGGSYNVE